MEEISLEEWASRWEKLIKYTKSSILNPLAENDMWEAWKELSHKNIRGINPDICLKIHKAWLCYVGVCLFKCDKGPINKEGKNAGQ